ncbi:hypothetical protein MalM25_02710 [Planctomycetes bacterium MalM25]|nr:hypothetical protein MalM25_02710 [Planctomycetes bacterium MalM25]
MSRLPVMLFAFIAGGFALTGQAQALDFAGAELTGSGVLSITTFSPNPFTVGAGVDVTGSQNSGQEYLFDFEGDLLTMTGTSPTNQPPQQIIGSVTFTDTSDSLPAFTSFEIISSVGVPTAQLLLSHTDDSLTIAFNEVGMNLSHSFTARVTAVPEPASALLALIGLAGFTARRR